MAQPCNPLLTAPHRIATVALTVRDLGRVAGFYRDALGLAPLGEGAGEVTLGVGRVPLLRLRGDPGAAPGSPREAGLFHTAFLLPSRADLGAWLAHAAALDLPLQGAADHLVSEAVYLADPEGNGIEVYADRPAADWPRAADGSFAMRNDPLDSGRLLRLAPERPWRGAPDGTGVGHVHLKVGDLGRADAFYREGLGFGVTCRYPGATFLGTGGYHHQLAANIWSSRGVGRRDPRAAGLAEIEVATRRDALDAARSRLGGTGGDPLVLEDPWGTCIALVPA